jgi:Ca2+-binding RTX toxin-like protein
MTSSDRGTKLTKRVSLAIVAATAALLVIPSGASAGVQIGETFTPTVGSCTADTTRLQTISAPTGAQYAAPTDGVITRWSFQAAATAPQIKFKVGHNVGGTNFQMAGESALVSPVLSTLNSFFIRVPVKAGDVIGTYTNVGSGTSLCNRTQAGYTYNARFGDVLAPTTADFNSPHTDSQIDVSALLEPDCDKDGLGDETQDTALTGCTTTPLTCRGKQLTIVGTPGNDSIVGTSGRDVIGSLGGGDVVRALGGNDLVCGGGGKDTLKGGPGSDKLYGQGAKDKLVGGGANDKCVGGNAADKAKGCETEKTI